MVKSNIVLIDICGTIFNSNTTFDFLAFLFQKNNRYYNLFNKLRKTFFWRCFNKSLYYIFRLDLTRIIALRYLKGLSKDFLLEQSQIFYDDFLSTLINKEVYEEIIQLQSCQENELILVSATIDVVAQIIASNLSIDKYLSTSLNYDLKNICLGSISNDLLGKKSLFLKQENINPPYFLTITDNLDDIDILNLSQNKFIIIHKNEAKWTSLLRNSTENKKIKKFYV